MKIKNYVKCISVLFLLSLFVLSGCSQEEAMEEIYLEELQDQSLGAKSSNAVVLPIADIAASVAQANNPAKNAIDDSASSRWSGEGSGVNLIMDLGTAQQVDYINIAWYKGNERRSDFEIWVRETSSSAWTRILDTQSSGTTTALETYDLTNSNSRYIRIKGFGNSSNAWNSITDIEIYGGNTILPDGGCTATVPSGKTAKTSSKTAVTLSWDAVSNSDHYNVRYKMAGSSTWTYKTSIRGTSIAISGLAPGTTYEWQIRAKCADNTGSSYSSGAGPDFTLGTIDDDPTVNPGGPLNPNAAPSANFDLRNWYLSIPVNKEGFATSISQSSLQGYEKKPYFYTNENNGGMVFKTFVNGVTTSLNTKFTRSELRELLSTSGDKKDIKNNWVLSSYTGSDKGNAGGINGEMTATLAVNHVTTTGSSSSKVGRMIIGQIHAINNEPCRLYYRKLTKYDKGSIYFVHETAGGSEKAYEIIGGESSSIAEPSNGIKLNETFSYKISAVGTKLKVTIMRPGKSDVSKEVDMKNSGYENEYMYFKAGVYNQNEKGDNDDYDQATFYSLETTHD